MPEWERAKAEHPGARFVAISVVADESAIGGHGLTEPLLVATGDVLTPLGLDGVPGIAVVAGGRVVAVARDGAGADEIGDAVVGAGR